MVAQVYIIFFDLLLLDTLLRPKIERLITLDIFHLSLGNRIDDLSEEICFGVAGI